MKLIRRFLRLAGIAVTIGVHGPNCAPHHGR